MQHAGEELQLLGWAHDHSSSCITSCSCVAVLQDFEGGHIKGAINLDSYQFSDDAAVDDLIDNKLANKSRVVVHCMLSQQRGPRCGSGCIPFC